MSGTITTALIGDSFRCYMTRYCCRAPDKDKNKEKKDDSEWMEPVTKKKKKKKSSGGAGKERKDHWDVVRNDVESKKKNKVRWANLLEEMDVFDVNDMEDDTNDGDLFASVTGTDFSASFSSQNSSRGSICESIESANIPSDDSVLLQAKENRRQSIAGQDQIDESTWSSFSDSESSK